MSNKLDKIEFDLKERLKTCPMNSMVKYLIDFISDFKRELNDLNEKGESTKANTLILNLFYERHLLNHFHFEKNKDYEAMANYFNTFILLKNPNPFNLNYQKIPFDLTLTKINFHIEKENNTSCYIATMAYGNYNHPQVMELRRFRDNFLSKTIIGRNFIKLYYKYSPSLVEKLKNKHKINLIIRKGLDKFIKTIKK